jgi:hypothetical protein
MATFSGWFRNLVVAAFVVTVTRADVSVGPQNVAVVAGNQVILSCTSSLTENERIQFIEYVTNPAGSVISDGTTLLPGHDNYFRYGLVADAIAGTYELTIRDTVLADGGKYACRDINSLPFATYGYADVVIIEATPNCTTTLPSNRIVTVDDYYTAECTVRFWASSGISPTLTWTGPGEFTTAVLGQNGSAWSGAAFYVSTAMDGSAFQCKTNFTSTGFGGADTANNVPTWQHTYSTGLLFVQYGPKDVYYTPVQESYEIGQVLTCHADAVPLPTYKWIDMQTLIEYNSQTLTLTTNMVGEQVFRCQVTNSVSTANKFVNITVNPITTPTTPPSTTPAPTIPAIDVCDDLTGRWEYTWSNGVQTVLCINVDASRNGVVYGFWWNDTNEPYFPEIIGRTRIGEYDEIGFSTMWADRLGVTSMAGECRKCYGTEILMVNAVSRTSSDNEFCADGGEVYNSPQLDFNRVATSYPCSENVAQLEANIQASQAQLPAQRRRRRRHVARHD